MKTTGSTAVQPVVLICDNGMGDLDGDSPLCYIVGSHGGGQITEMLYLLLAIASSAMVSICMRISEKYVRNTMVMFTANYAVCLAMSRFYMGSTRVFISETGMEKAVTLGIISGFLYLVCFMLLQQNIRHNGVVLSSASMKLGAVLVPVMAAVLVFHEQMRWVQLAGVVLAAAAILLINIEKGNAGQGGKKLWLAGLLAVNGLTDTMANIYDKTGAAGLKNHYLFYTFLAALFLAFVMALLKREAVTLPDICCGLLIGIPNYYSAKFILLSLGSVPAVIVYPAYSVGTIITITLAGLIAFHESLSRQKKYALLLILAALVMLNI